MCKFAQRNSLFRIKKAAQFLEQPFVYAKLHNYCNLHFCSAFTLPVTQGKTDLASVFIQLP